MLVFNIKQVNLEYILHRMKQNLKHATPIQIKNLHTVTDPNLVQNRKLTYLMRSKSTMYQILVICHKMWQL